MHISMDRSTDAPMELSIDMFMDVSMHVPMDIFMEYRSINLWIDLDPDSPPR